MGDYRAFIERKSQLGGNFGFDPIFRHPQAYDFQSDIVDRSVRKGRAAIFADCGLGKTLMQLAWAENVFRKKAKPVLLLTPLIVAAQTVQEAHKFDLAAKRSVAGEIDKSYDVIVTNYERLHMFDPSDFSGVVCDESGILKNFDGAYKSHITEFMRKVEYRLLCSATPSPNDYIELGTSSEALGHMGYMDMLGMFFKNDEDSLHPMSMGAKWRFKSHAQRDFWRWVCSWATACRKPSDLGYDDGAFVLPDKVENTHLIDSPVLDGYLFPTVARGLDEERNERRSTINARCERAAELCAGHDVSVAWCDLNAEGDTLTSMIPGAVQISGSDHDDRKEEVVTAFVAGQIKKIVTKPKIAGYGVNWQHCAHMTYFPDHSFEKYYQSVRRFWRFGQKMPVTVDNITTQALVATQRNMARKIEQAERMFESMIFHMNNELNINRYKPHPNNQELPTWL